MGSLICGLLLVIAISCTCKLIALRQVETQQQLNDTVETHRVGGPSSYPRSFPFACNDTDTPLFRLEHEFFYREPPPSYAAAVGGQSDTPYDRQNRRQQRRLRRHRRRPPSPPPVPEEDIATRSAGAHLGLAHVQANQLPPSSAHHTIVDSRRHSCGEGSPSDKTLDSAKGSPSSSDEVPTEVSSCPESNTTPATTTTTTTSTGNDVSIELDSISIPSPSQIDCDEQPLLS